MQAGDSKKNLLQLRKSIYQEVDAMQDDIRDKKLVSWYLMQVEQLEYGPEEAARRHSERRKQLK